MDFKKLISNYRPQWIFLFRLISIYSILYLATLFFIGLTVKGGVAYSSWIDENINLIKLMRSILLGASQLILEALGYDTYLGEYTLGIVNQGGIRLVYECLGFELTFGYIALVSAYPFQGKRSWGYLILGIILIQLLNVVRIFGLTILFATQKASAFEIVDHHDLFNLAVIIVLIIAYWRFLPKEGAK